MKKRNDYFGKPYFLCLSILYSFWYGLCLYSCIADEEPLSFFPLVVFWLVQALPLLTTFWSKYRLRMVRLVSLTLAVVMAVKIVRSFLPSYQWCFVLGLLVLATLPETFLRRVTQQ
ncbi:hypothetical protein [Streptococcus ovuberis]|uniref:Uncharacterized protein n=1 Tax=Streptococcus ovuberis TaxID=1936207 RepID=A0A7X6S141_9STRE|nr:hypothetical protein [Streptococcus ovuberis]NKZ20853.1 hypothetical protein [Streptococcus ovuberis]